MNGDLVITKILRKMKKREKQKEIVRILERANKTIVGVYEDSRNFGFVVADDKFTMTIFIPKEKRLEPKLGT